MQRRVAIVVAVCMVFLGVNVKTVHAAEGFVTPFIGAVFSGDVPSSRATYGASILGNQGPIGAELEFGYTPTLLQDPGTKVKLLTLTGNILIGLPLGAFHPYGSAGLGLMRQQTSVSLSGFLNDITNNDFGYSLGGGAWAMVTTHVGLRGDVRYFRIRKTDGFNFGRAYGGLIVAF